jgi:hypothetical protein
MAEQIHLSHIFFLFLEDGSVGLRSFANWTFSCLLNPLSYAFLVVGMFALEFD